MELFLIDIEYQRVYQHCNECAATSCYKLTCRHIDQDNGVCTLLLFCKDKSGRSVILRDPRYIPFIFVSKPSVKVKDIRRDINYLADIIVESIPYASKLFRQLVPVDAYKISCVDDVTLNKAISSLSYKGYIFYDTNITVTDKYLTWKNLRIGSWFRAQTFPCHYELAKSKVEFLLDSAVMIDDDTIPEPSVLCFDIECQSHNHNAFPDPYHPDAFIYMIGIVHRVPAPSTNADSTPKVTRLCLYLEHPHKVSSTKEIGGIEFCAFKKEVDMIIGFFDLINKLDPDIITGYNILSFDFAYIWKRMCYMINVHINISRLKAYRGVFRELEWASSAYGDNLFYIPKCFGRIVLDTMQYVKRELRLQKYSLNHVAKTLFNESKVDLSPRNLFQAISDGDLPTIAEYCIQDVELTLKIFDKVNVWYGCVEMSKLTDVRIEELYTRGESRKILLQLYRECSAQRILLNDYVGTTSVVQGAAVMDPEVGLHEWCITLDFSSLYPSIVISENICYSTYNGSSFHREKIGIVPALLANLISKRKYYKGLLKEVNPLSALGMIYDKRQNALKICANSVYGCFGTASIKCLYLPDAARKVTSMGRYYIAESRRIIESEHHLKVLYGDTDSCMIAAPMLVTDNKYNECIKIGNELATSVSAQFPKEVELSVDNVFSRIMFITKKRYAGIDAKNGQAKVKGLVTVRSDTCSFIRSVNSAVIDKCLAGITKFDINTFIRSEIESLRHGKVPFDDLIMSSTLRGDYNTTTSPGARFKALSAELGREYPAGVKIEYVIVESTSTLFGEKWRDIAYYDHSEDIDYEYYVERLRKSLDKVLAIL